jgi:hypothetical protein
LLPGRESAPDLCTEPQSTGNLVPRRHRHLRGAPRSQGHRPGTKHWGRGCPVRSTSFGVDLMPSSKPLGPGTGGGQPACHERPLRSNGGLVRAGAGPCPTQRGTSRSNSRCAAVERMKCAVLRWHLVAAASSTWRTSRYGSGVIGPPAQALHASNVPISHKMPGTGSPERRSSKEDRARGSNSSMLSTRYRARNPEDAVGDS